MISENHRGRARGFDAKGLGTTSRLFVLVLALAVGGCEFMRDAYRVDDIVYGATTEKVAAEEEFDYFDPIILENETDFVTARDARGPSEDGRLARNRLQAKIMALSDRVCEQHKGAIVADASAINSGLGFTSLVFSGAAAVVGGEAAKSALAAVAAVSTGTRALVNEQIYQQLLVGTIIEAISKGREKKGGALLVRRAEPIDEYTLYDSIREVQEYHALCSFYNGITILADATKRISLSRDEIMAQLSDLDERIATLRTEQAGLTGQQLEAIRQQISVLDGQRQALTLQLGITRNK